MKGRGIDREGERKKIQRVKRFLLKFLVKYPEWRMVRLNIANKIEYIYITLFLLQNYRNLKTNHTPGLNSIKTFFGACLLNQHFSIAEALLFTLS